ncbi:hypothetical protein OF83DRAFT_922365 [Amylostereum chailletii]|nr:hypothetical protein OF83DRAFT_922365 [Amylostereum chailletii]
MRNNAEISPASKTCPQTPSIWTTALRSRLVALGNVAETSDLDTVSQIQQQIDEEMREITDAASAMLSHRNSLSLVFRLPPELLAHIFHLLFQDIFMHSAGDYHGGPFAVTHVCRRWRQIALDSSGLWAHGVCAMPKWVPEQLSRSKQAPLSIASRITSTSSFVFSTAGPVYRAALNLALKEMHRIRDIDLHISQVVPSVFDNLSQHAPLLETLKLTSHTLHALPPDIFRLGAPRLAYLELCGWVPPRHSGMYGNIVAFSLCDVETGSLTGYHLLSVLASMPKLEILKLSQSFCMVNPPEATNLTLPLTFPSSFHTIVAVDHPENIHWLWTHIIFPPSTRTAIRCTPDAASSYERLIQLHRCLPSATVEVGGGSSIRTLVVDRVGSQTWSIKGCPRIVTSPSKRTAGHNLPFEDVDFPDTDSVFHFKSAMTPVVSPSGDSTHSTALVTFKLEAIIRTLYVDEITTIAF